MRRCFGAIAARRLWLLNLLLAAAAVPPAVHLATCPIRFNQFMIGRLELAHGLLSAGDAWRMIRSAYASGWDVLTRRPSRRAPDFDDARAMFAHVFSWIPPYAVVYPTEGFYYFRTRVRERDVWGNVRVADLDQGKLTMAYFDFRSRRTHMLEIGERDGLSVRRLSPFRYDVGFRGKTVRFEIPGIAERPPRGLRRLAEEDFVGRVHDESGLRLFLFYNRATEAFYYVLDEESGVCDELRPEGGLLVGRRTKVAFYDDREFDRRLLMGVALANVEVNNFFDGPGDQVPFRADLRDRLYTAYPNTRLGDGTDAHGVLLNRPEWVRVAIVPYERYSSLRTLSERLERLPAGATPSERWTLLTKEWWNSLAYRTMILRMLEREGKDVTDLRRELALAAVR